VRASACRTLPLCCRSLLAGPQAHGELMGKLEPALPKRPAGPFMAREKP